MGNYLATPDKSKENINGEGNGIKFGASAMQGWRLNMEDAHITDAKFTADSSLFAVFDGHGGREVARYCAKYFGDALKKNPKFKNGTNVKQALEETFFEMDEHIIDPKNSKEILSMKNSDDPEPTKINGGCTANVILIHKDKVYCANAGDSRSILYSDGLCIPMSKDHKPEDPQELDRIKKAGGTVTMGRINFGLNLSRAIGDMDNKGNTSLPADQQMVICKPDIMERTMNKDKDTFIIMGCDGVWELQTMQVICSKIEGQIDQGVTR